MSLTRSSSAISAQLATSDDPPAERNGVVRPVSGMRLVTPPTTTKTCRPTTNARPNGEQPSERVAGRQRDRQAPRDDDRVEDEHGHEAGDAEQLAERPR